MTWLQTNFVPGKKVQVLDSNTGVFYKATIQKVDEGKELHLSYDEFRGCTEKRDIDKYQKLSNHLVFMQYLHCHILQCAFLQ